MTHLVFYFSLIGRLLCSVFRIGMRRCCWSQRAQFSFVIRTERLFFFYFATMSNEQIASGSGIDGDIVGHNIRPSRVRLQR